MFGLVRLSWICARANCAGNGIKVKLQDQPFQILAMLLEQPGQVVTREELRSRLWPFGYLRRFRSQPEQGG
jgi:DNA-binding response OmpR family regulator